MQLKPNLLGNQNIWQSLVHDFQNHNMAHAYLFAGPVGVGKASAAKEYIKYILQANDVLAKRIEEDNFLDLLILNNQEKNEITIDMVRKASNFFEQTPTECPYKFVIIDSVDDLNVNAANSLLKIIEEPRNNTYIFLISHQPYNLLATIRSRCRIIRFKPLELEQLKSIVDLDDASYMQDLIAGSPNKAINLLKLEIIPIYEQLLQLISDNNVNVFNKFADKIVNHQDKWNVIKELSIYALVKCIKISANAINSDQLSDLERRMLTPVAFKKSVDEWFKIYDKLTELFANEEVYNLDKKQVLFITINRITS